MHANSQAGAFLLCDFANLYSDIKNTTQKAPNGTKEYKSSFSPFGLLKSTSNFPPIKSITSNDDIIKINERLNNFKCWKIALKDSTVVSG